MKHASQHIITQCQVLLPGTQLAGLHAGPAIRLKRLRNVTMVTTLITVILNMRV